MKILALSLINQTFTHKLFYFSTKSQKKNSIPLFYLSPKFHKPSSRNRRSSADQSQIWNHKPLRWIPNRRTSNPFVVLLHSIRQYLRHSPSIPLPFSFNPPPFSAVPRYQVTPSLCCFIVLIACLLFNFSLSFCC
jgi:hypothetical protein